MFSLRPVTERWGTHLEPDVLPVLAGQVVLDTVPRADHHRLLTGHCQHTAHLLRGVNSQSGKTLRKKDSKTQMQEGKY